MGVMFFQICLASPGIPRDQRYASLLRTRRRRGVSLSQKDYPDRQVGILVNNHRKEWKLKMYAKSSSMTNERIQHLVDTLGFAWNSHDEIWNNSYLEMAAYNKEKGNVHFPREYMTENGLKLGHWVINQCTQWSYNMENKTSSMTDERIGLLDNLGFVWDLFGTLMRRAGWSNTTHLLCTRQSTYMS